MTNSVSSRILDYLDGGIASSSRIDGLGKGVGEYLRSKHVDIPVRFLERHAESEQRNGHSNGVANGHSKGGVNGHTNGVKIFG